MLTSETRLAKRFPVRRKNGTPDQRQLSTRISIAAYVSVKESRSTFSSDKYPRASPAPVVPGPYWARTARNPRTGEAIQVKASKVPRFKAGARLKGAVK